MSLLTSIAIASFLFALLLLLLLRFFAPRKRSSDDSPFLQADGALPPPPKRKGRAAALAGPIQVAEGKRGDPRTCPVCAAKFEHGESVRSKIFPPTERNDRLLHISGCPYCVFPGGRRRECPVCGAELELDEYLTARIFQRLEKSHVHIVGCPHCRKG